VQASLPSSFFRLVLGALSSKRKLKSIERDKLPPLRSNEGVICQWPWLGAAATSILLFMVVAIGAKAVKSPFYLLIFFVRLRDKERASGQGTCVDEMGWQLRRL